MLISEVYTRLLSFLDIVISDLNVKVIYANQNSPRPTKPFITLSLSSFRVLAMPIKGKIYDTGLQDVITSTAFTATIEAYSDQLHQAEELLNLIERYLRTEIAYQHFRADMSYTRTLSGVTTLPNYFEGTTESRATLDIEFLVNMLIKDDTGIIEHVVVTDVNRNEQITIDIE